MTPAERAAAAIYNAYEDGSCSGGDSGDRWPDALARTRRSDVEIVQDYRTMARAALDAALDVEELARAIDAEAFCTPWHQAHDPRDRMLGAVRQANALAVARVIRTHILGQTAPDRTGISDTTTRSDSEGSEP